MSTSRTVEPELLDMLAPDDPRAMRAHRDLQRVNAIMGQKAIWKGILRNEMPRERPPSVIVELGAGDGSLMSRLAPALAIRWPRVKVYLVDRHPAVAGMTLQDFASLGWQAEVVKADVMVWLNTMPAADIVLANLFLHHFSDPQLAGLLQQIAAKTEIFAACEPRRSSTALFGSRLLGLIGCGPVTRNDAVVSVRAGFSGMELSALWPDRNCWYLRECKAGLFTHTFLARRLSAATLSVAS
ncbi:MAG: methyltransferase domain-containing protein [Gammaproteobacteria bacterium]|nr:methyltransferase domain-containing protein [Gammaproteobacteria bacterium]